MNNGIEINGPMNIITIEGSILDENGNRRDIKLSTIADYHEDPNKQTECLNIRSVDLSKYLIRLFENYKNKGDKLHFFIETIPINHDKITDKRGRYADSVINMLLKSFQMPGKGKNGIVYSSEIFPNVVLSYIDIRPIIFPSMDRLFRDISEYMTQSWATMNDNPVLVENIIGVFEKINKIISFAYNSLYQNRNIVRIEDLIREANITDEEIIKESIKLILYKIKYSFKNPEIKKVFQNYIDTELKDKFNLFFVKYKEIIQYLENLKIVFENKDKIQKDEMDGMVYGIPYLSLQQLIVKLDKMIYELNHIWFVEITSKIMDLYLLRHLLNNYIKYAITYTGIEHTMFIIYFLVKNLNFKITKASKINNISIEELNNKIKTGKFRDFHEYLYPKKIDQCSISSGMYDFQ